jgi:hypothetical protein
VVFIHYGRIGTAGQHKVDHLPSIDKAEEVALRQFYTKAAKGYTVVENNFLFEVDRETFEEAASAEYGSRLSDAWAKALTDNRFTTKQVEVFAYYDGILADANRIIENAKSGQDLETLIAQHRDLEQTVEAIKEKHDTVNTQVTIAKMMLAQRLSGSKAS